MADLVNPPQQVCADVFLFFIYCDLSVSRCVVRVVLSDMVGQLFQSLRKQKVLLVSFLLKGLLVILDVDLILDQWLGVGGLLGSLISICTTFLSVCFTPYIYCISIDYTKIETISQSTRANILFVVQNTFSTHEAVAFITDQATLIFPLQAVFEFADVVYFLEVFLTFSTQTLCLFDAPLDGTQAAFEFVVAKTFHTCSSVVFETSRLHWLAAAGLGNIVAALARITAVVIVRFAVRNHTLIVLEFERFEAFKANMISLFQLASQHQVVFTFSKNQRVLALASSALILGIILFTIFDSFLAETIHSDKSVSTI